MESSERIVIQVTDKDGSGLYNVTASQGTSVGEIAFAMMVVIKSLKKEKLIKSYKEFLRQVQNYLSDPQYNEV